MKDADRKLTNRQALLRLPGRIASILMIAFTALWSYWGVAEMYHEGWWGSWLNRLPYLAPIALTLLPTLAAFRWPRLGGIAILLVGAFTVFFFRSAVAWIGLAIVLLGAAFLFDGWMRRREVRGNEVEPPDRSRGWREHWRTYAAVGAPALIFIGLSIYHLPIVLSRIDDGERGARRIEGAGVVLVWAPEGPGWNIRHPWVAYPSWQQLALYGAAPVGLGDKPGYGRQPDGSIIFATAEDMQRTGLCRYLTNAGTALRDEPQDIWRMPTADEVVRSLGRHGENAGCTWQGEIGRFADCAVRPDKETPLWAPDLPAIYYWAAESDGDSRGYFVSFNGMVNSAYKLGGNPRHSYRCVRDP